MKNPLKRITLYITVCLLIVSIAGCALLPDLPPPATPTPPASSLPLSDYEPQPGDDKLTRDQVSLDVENSQVVIKESLPAQVSLILNGTLSDPCHQLRVVVTPANTDKAINLDVYSVVDPNVGCISVLKSFSATIPLGSYVGGHYTVYVNGQLAGDFDT
jgi:hypothetical protein